MPFRIAGKLRSKAADNGFKQVLFAYLVAAAICTEEGLQPEVKTGGRMFTGLKRKLRV